MNSTMNISIGSKIPDFSAITNKGSFKLQDYRGKYLVIYFYPKDDTPGCTIQAKDFRDLYKDFQHKNVEIIGVSRDTVVSHTKFECKYELPFPLISDTDSKICDLFGVINNKFMFGKTALGVVRSTFLIDPAGVLIKEWRKVSAKAHAQKVLEEVDTFLLKT